MWVPVCETFFEFALELRYCVALNASVLRTPSAGRTWPMSIIRLSPTRVTLQRSRSRAHRAEPADVHSPPILPPSALAPRAPRLRAADVGEESGAGEGAAALGGGSGDGSEGEVGMLEHVREVEVVDAALDQVWPLGGGLWGAEEKRGGRRGQGLEARARAQLRRERGIRRNGAARRGDGKGEEVSGEPGGRGKEERVGDIRGIWIGREEVFSSPPHTQRNLKSEAARSPIWPTIGIEHAWCTRVHFQTIFVPPSLSSLLRPPPHPPPTPQQQRSPTSPRVAGEVAYSRRRARAQRRHGRHARAGDEGGGDEDGMADGAAAVGGRDDEAALRHKRRTGRGRRGRGGERGGEVGNEASRGKEFAYSSPEGEGTFKEVHLSKCKPTVRKSYASISGQSRSELDCKQEKATAGQGRLVCGETSTSHKQANLSGLRIPSSGGCPLKRARCHRSGVAFMLP